MIFGNRSKEKYIIDVSGLIGQPVTDLISQLLVRDSSALYRDSAVRGSYKSGFIEDIIFLPHKYIRMYK